MLPPARVPAARALGAFDPTGHIVSLLARQGLPAPRGAALRRLGTSAADARMFLASAPEPAARERLVAILESDPAIESVRLRRAELTVRFSAAHVQAVRDGLCDGLAAVLGPGPDSGRRFTLNFLNPNATKPLHIGHLRNVALGQALAAHFEGRGAAVRRQVYVCDIGRNVCEALAGWEVFHAGATPESAGLLPDVFVGHCYADYARTRVSDVGNDDPAATESEAVGDRADEIVRGWLRGDDAIRGAWGELREWALGGQSRTLDRLGVRFERRWFESDSIERAGRLVELGLGRGWLVRTDEGGVVYPTGRAGYGQLPLVRADGFPTEHLRVIALFAMEQDESPAADRWIVVCGDEWSAAGSAELELVARLAPGPLAPVVDVVAHGMVTVGGSKMKSRDGRALTIDALLDGLERDPRITLLCERSQPHVTPAEAAQILARGYFLCRRPTRAIEYDWDGLFDAAHNPGSALLRAWCRPPDADEPRAANENHADMERTLVLQAHQLRGLVFADGAEFAPTEVAKFANGVAAWYLEQPAPPAVHGTARALLGVCLDALGLRATGAARGSVQPTHA